jgi:putative salt-induced outer membrane protein YdiY
VLDPKHDVILEPPPKIWKGSVDMGLNGSEGNSQVFNFRFNAQITRETPDSKLKLVTNYVRTNSNGTDTANRLFFDGRDELLFETSPWTLYVHETSEYDEFKDFDARVTADAGIGYQIIKNDLTSLIARMGPGFSYEVDGQDEVIPELAMSLALEHQLTKFQKLAISVDFFPAFENFSDYRCNTQASWQMVIDEENNLSLKLSAVDRYDSTPGDGLQPNELDYAATLLWSF